MENKKKFTVNRKTWLRGEGSQDSYLLRIDDNKKCCLGFFAEQISDCSTYDIADIASPTKIISPELFDENMDLEAWVHIAMLVNDSETYSDEWREKELIRIFAENGYELEFV